MLIKITKSCHNGCIHCCNDSKPSDEHMTIDTFIKALEFAEKYDSYNILGNELAGGEPTEHPQFFEFIDVYYTILGIKKPLTIATNGHFLLENPDKIHEYLDKYPFLNFQVTYDNRYYPKKLDITKRALRHKRIGIVTEVTHITPQGRAATNNLPIDNKVMGPSCTNLRLVSLQSPYRSLGKIIQILRQNNKYCTPSIQFDGGIAFGEYDCCPKLCTIYDTEEYILNKLDTLECDRCPIASKIMMEKSIAGNLKIRTMFGDKL